MQNKPAGDGFVGNGLFEKDIFYYHSDHLGSTSYISTQNGQLSQHVEYIAFGEVLFEEHSSSVSMPYLFNGKELDRETNLSYYGARYLDMKTSLWLNVDPKMEKYPSYSSYNFCLNNPITYKDPDGRDVILVTETKGTGHTFVVVKSGNNVTVYTYGRYQGGNALTAGTTGPGVLVKYTGAKAEEYIKTELHRMEAKAFHIKDASDSKVKAAFDNQFNASKEKATSDNADINANGKVIDTYSLFGNNCTTKSSDALKYGGSAIFDVDGFLYNYDEDFTIPSSLQKYLENNSKTNSNVLDVTENLKKLYPNTANKKLLKSAGSSGTSSGSGGSSSGGSANSSSTRSSSSGNGSGSFGSGSGSSSSQDYD